MLITSYSFSSDQLDSHFDLHTDDKALQNVLVVQPVHKMDLDLCEDKHLNDAALGQTAAANLKFILMQRRQKINFKTHFWTQPHFVSSVIKHVSSEENEVI